MVNDNFVKLKVYHLNGNELLVAIGCFHGFRYVLKHWHI